MTCSSTKLLYYHLRSYIVKKQVDPILYCLKFSPTLQRLHLIFHIIKLISTSKDLILERYSSLSLNMVIIGREEE